MDSSPAIDSNPVVQELQRIQGEVYRLRAQRAEQQPLPALVRKMILLFNGKRPLDQVCELCGISLGKGRAVARKLQLLGTLERLSHVEDSPADPPPRDEPDDFSWEEEAFFASELPPIDACDIPFETFGSKVKKVLGKIRRR
jgi:hypothetical protein